MKILFVNNVRYRSGGEEYLMDLLPGLSKKGAMVGIVCRPHAPLASMLKGTSVHVYPVEKSGIRGLLSTLRIARIIRREKYEIISIQRGHDIIQSWIASLLSGRRPELVFTAHTADFIKSRFLLGRMQRIVAISRHIFRKIEDLSPMLSGRTSVINNGIDVQTFNAANAKRGAIRGRYGISADTCLISTCGIMWKNQIEFLDALVEIKKEIPGVRYLLLTPLAYVPQVLEFKARAAQLGLTDSVLWLNSLPKEKMPDYYADLDLAVSTYRNEGFGLWVVEALAMGTPVVAFDGGGVRDILEGSPAAVLIKDGAVEMTREVIRILKNRETLKRMSNAGPKWAAERFSKERMVEDYFRFYQGFSYSSSSPNDSRGNPVSSKSLDSQRF
jgi:glycosyltransferase involved in cell wall biosynthesis